MKEQETLILSISRTDLYNFDELQIEECTQFILENIKVSKMEKQILKIIEDISGVAEPNLIADKNYIASDNQKRLTIINQLILNLQLVKKDITNLKKKTTIDSDYKFSFLTRIKDLCVGIVNYSILKHTELEEQMYQPNMLDILNGITTLEQKKKLVIKQKENKKLIGG